MNSNDVPHLLPLFALTGWQALRWSNEIADGLPSDEMRRVAALFDGLRTIGALEQLGVQPDTISELVRRGFATIVPNRSPTSTTEHWCVLSPHSDDASLSIGGTLAGLPDWVKVTIITMVGPSRCAGTCPSLDGDQVKVTQIRQTEDALYGAFIGASVYCAELDDVEMYVDQEGRQWCDHVMDAPDAARIEAFTTAVTARLLECTPDVVLAPLAVGGHCDHTATHLALRSSLPELRRVSCSLRVLFYEDLPYCQIEEPALIRRLEELQDLTPVEIPIDPLRKVEGASIYRSQYTREYLSSVLTEYALRRASADIGPYVERLWEIDKNGSQ